MKRWHSVFTDDLDELVWVAIILALLLASRMLQ
jgi:hypothetical protein